MNADVDAEVDWPAYAACRGADPELFYSEDEHDERAALRFCESCEVRAECLETAMARREPFGVWGGTVGRQRRRLFRRERRGTRAPRRHPARAEEDAA